MTFPESVDADSCCRFAARTPGNRAPPRVRASCAIRAGIDRKGCEVKRGTNVPCFGNNLWHQQLKGTDTGRHGSGPRTRDRSI